MGIASRLLGGKTQAKKANCFKLSVLGSHTGPIPAESAGFLDPKPASIFTCVVAGNNLSRRYQGDRLFFLLDLVKLVVLWLARSRVSSSAMISTFQCPRFRRVLEAGTVTVPSVSSRVEKAVTDVMLSPARSSCDNNPGGRSSGWSPGENTFQYCGYELQGEKSETGLQHYAAVPGAGRCPASVEAEPVGSGRRKARSLRGQAIDPDSELDSSVTRSLHPCMSPIDRDRLVSAVLHGCCKSHAARGDTNSCDSKVWLFLGALQGEGVFSALFAAEDWVKKGSYHTAWSVSPRMSEVQVGGKNIFLPLTKLETGKGRGRTAQRGRSPVIPHALVHMRMGMAPTVFWTVEGYRTLLKPWCAEDMCQPLRT